MPWKSRLRRWRRSARSDSPRRTLAGDLVATDTNGKYDVFVYDRESDELELVSLAADGSTPADDSSLGRLWISADGQVVAFASDATNLVPDDDNGKTDVFVYDRQTNSHQRVSVDADGNDTLFESHSPTLSGDGRYVVFDSFSPNLVPDDGNAFRDVFVVDRVANTIELVTLTPDGGQANGPSWDAVITPDGRYVVAVSEARNLISGDTNNRTDVYVFPGPNADTPDVRAVAIGPDETISGIDFGNLFLPLPEFRMDVTLTEAAASNHNPATGEIDIFPANLDWMDEWTSFYVGIWVTGGGAAVSSASLTFDYNTDYFTATDVQFGPAFENALELTETIDDSSGAVQLGGSTTVAEAGDDRPTLLATVRFAASNNDLGIPLVPNGEHVTPQTDLGFQVEAPLINRTGLGEGVPAIGPLSATQLWPVMYDMDDDNRAHFSDLAFWAAEFPGYVGDPGADRAGIADFEHNGRVFFEDLSFFAANFGRSKEELARLIYSPNFPRDWQPQPLRAAVGTQDLRSLPTEELQPSSTDEKDFGSLNQPKGQRTQAAETTAVRPPYPIPHPPFHFPNSDFRPPISDFRITHSMVLLTELPTPTRSLWLQDTLLPDDNSGGDGFARRPQRDHLERRQVASDAFGR